MGTQNHHHDPLFQNIYIKNKNRFKNSIFSSKDELEKALGFFSDLDNINFVNGVGLYFQSQDMDIKLEMLKSFEFWKNEKIDIADGYDNFGFEIINALEVDNKKVYSKKYFYDISQTNLTLDKINYKKITNTDEIYSRLKNSICSSLLNNDELQEIFSSTKYNSPSKIVQIADYFSNYYFLDNATQQDVFNYMFLHKMNLSVELKNESFKELSNTFAKDINVVVDIFNTLNRELFLHEMILSTSLETPFYEKLGVKDVALKNKFDKKYHLSLNNAKEYQSGINIKDFNFKDSKLIAKDILDNEKIQREVKFINLFLSTTKLNILSGDYSGESFVVEGDLDLDELKILVADEFLSKIVAKDIIKNFITIRKTDEFRGNKELFSREYQDDTQQLHEASQKSTLQSTRTGEHVVELSDREINPSNETPIKLNGAGIQRSGGVGDSEQRSGLFLEPNHIISLKYRYLFEDAVFDTFTHTQTHEILDILKINKKLKTDEFKDFNKYLSINNLGYYSRVAKAFIIKDNKLVEFYKKSDSDLSSENKEIFWDKIIKIKLTWSDFAPEEDLEFSDLVSLQKYYETLNKETLINQGGIKKTKLEISFSNEIDNATLVINPQINLSLNEKDFNPFSGNIKDYLSSLYKNGINLQESGEPLAVSFNKITDEGKSLKDTGLKADSEVLEVEIEPIKDDNFVIEDIISLGGSKTKFKNYIAGIDVVRKIESGETISFDEKIVLSKMGGIGTIAQAFYRTDGSVVKGWENEAAELKAILSDDEYREAQRATLDAYYTDEVIAKAMWKAVERFGFSRGSILEPSVGIGNFFGYMPKKFKPTTQLLGVEINATSAKVAQILYPKSKIFNVGFQNFSLLAGAKASLVIGNPPFGSHKILDGTNSQLNGKSIHNYFMGKSADMLEDGGVMAMVVSSSFLDSSDSNTRTYIADKANLIGAIRLPKGSFSNANTEVVTDIVFFQKKEAYNKIENEEKEWLFIGEINDTPINKYYEKHPENLLGEWGKFGSMYRGDEACLIAREGQNTEQLLNQAIEKLPAYINFDNGKNYYDTKALPNGTVTSSKTIMEFVGFNNQLASSLQNDDDTMASDARINSYFKNGDELYMRLPNRNGKMISEAVKTRINSAGEEVELKPTEVERIFGMIGVAEIATQIKNYQLQEDADLDNLDFMRKKLNDTYDAFVKKYGFLNNRTNSNLFEDDVRSPFLLALETKYEQGISRALAIKNNVESLRENATKADIFFKRTQKPFMVPTSASTIKDALNICLSEKAYVDLEFISSLVDKKQDDVTKYLSDDEYIFDDEDSGWVTKEEFLSGNVKEKLLNTRNFKNMEALKKVIPEDIDAIDINVSCGAAWIPIQDINDFIGDILGSQDAESYYVELNATWVIKKTGQISSSKQELYGSFRKSVQDCLAAALNNRQITVYDIIGEGEETRKVVNHEETTVANSKVDAIKERWNDWIWDSAERREKLATLYNDKFNIYAQRNFDGSHLKLHGKISDDIIDLRPHQKNAVWRVLQTGKILLDHTVGSGKTFTAITGVMELKRTGRANKALVAVPKHLTGQWGREWLQLYPDANILVASDKDFSAKRRKNLMAKIATGDWDAVIISHSQLTMIENDFEFQEKFLNDEIEKIQNAIDMVRLEEGRDARNIKNFMKTQENLTIKLANLVKSNKDDNIGFLELGIDSLVVDEFHEFKNLQFHTSLNSVRGLGNPLGSKKAFDIYIKIQSLLEKTGGKNLIVMTGTPISNSISEMFTLQRYMNSDELKIQRLEHFDAWAKQYTDILTDWELKPSGGYKLVTRMSKFKNIPELIGSYRNYADVVGIEDVKEALSKQGKVLDIPPVKGGRPKNFIVERSDIQAQFIGVKDENGNYPRNSLVYRSENLPTGQPQKGDDNILVIMNDARKCSLDMRVIDPTYPDYANSKINKSIEEMLRIYYKWDKLRGTQLIFCDLSTPKSSVSKERERLVNLEKLADSGDEKAMKELDNLSMDDIEALNSSFSVYDDIKEKLILFGIKKEEIAFIHEADNPKKKEELFSKVNSGKIRFLLGSTSKMGSGMNVQKRLVAEHHLDVPWRPSDLEQREGRIIRQGNLLFTLFAELQKEEKNNYKLSRVIEDLNLNDKDLNYIIENIQSFGEKFEVEINRYATKNSLDSGLWEKIENKARFISQLRKGDIKDREVEDVSGEEANAAEIKAASSGDPLVLEEMKLKQKINKLEINKRNFKRGVYDRENKIERAKSIIQNYSDDKKCFKNDLKLVKNYQLDMAKKTVAIEELKKENKAKGISNKDVKDFSGFAIEMDGKVYNSREDGGSYIINSIRKNQKNGVKSFEIGTFAGFDLSITQDYWNVCLVLSGQREYQFDFKLEDAKALGLISRLVNLLQYPEIEERRLDDKYQLNLLELPKLEALGIEFLQEDELKSLKKRYSEIINHFRKLDEDSRQSKNNNESINYDSSNVKEISSISVSWEDPNKDAVVFSADGIIRIKSLFDENCNTLNKIALGYNEAEHGDLSGLIELNTGLSLV